MQMTSIPNHQLSEISFPDCEITHFEISDTRLECDLDGMHLISRGLVEAPIRLVISHWQTVIVERSDATGANPVRLDMQNAGALREICECKFSQGDASIAGFDRQSGHWLQFIFSSADISVDIDE